MPDLIKVNYQAYGDDKNDILFKFYKDSVAASGYTLQMWFCQKVYPKILIYLLAELSLTLA